MLQSLDINLEQGWRQRELVLLLPAWVELSEPADRLPVQAHPSRAPWMKRWVRSRLVAGWPAAEQRLQIAFDIEEIHGALRCSPADESREHPAPLPVPPAAADKRVLSRTPEPGKRAGSGCNGCSRST